MAWKDSGVRGPGWSEKKSTGNLLALGILLAVLLVNAVSLLAFRTNGGSAGGASRLLVVVAVLAVVLCAAAAVRRAGKKRRTTGEEMHADHYRRTRQERPRGSADPCAYSEHHSWKKSQDYDDPWDF
ncbi:MAG: hypothetical protein ACI3WR_00485 [Oscillospiraceae bacterium]